jgi:hypothetical protein
VSTKSKELRGFAKEYADYAKKMPTDPFATRWLMIAEALRFQADALEKEEKERKADEETTAAQEQG